MSLDRRLARVAKLGRLKAERGGKKQLLPQATPDAIPYGSVRNILAIELADTVPAELRGVEIPNEPFHVWGSSHVEMMASLRAMPVPPAAPGSPDSDRDEIDPIVHRQALNAAKRARRARRSSR